MATTVKPISKAKAEHFFTTLKTRYQHWNTDEMNLSWEWRGDGHPVIIWESGSPYEWTINLEDINITGVWHEAYNSCVLSLYPS
jgi:hypothetical protein